MTVSLPSESESLQASDKGDNLVPRLVETPDGEPSRIGGKFAGGGRNRSILVAPMADRERTAVVNRTVVAHWTHGFDLGDRGSSHDSPRPSAEMNEAAKLLAHCAKAARIVCFQVIAAPAASVPE